MPRPAKIDNELLERLRFETAIGRIEHWIDNMRGNKAFSRRDKWIMAQAIRDFLKWFIEVRCKDG